MNTFNVNNTRSRISAIRSTAGVTARSIFSALLVALAIFNAVDVQAAATVRTWDGGAGNGAWTNATNWDAAPATGENFTFAGTTQLTTTNGFLTNTMTLGGLSFSAGAGAFILNGNQILLNGNIDNNGTNSTVQTINFDIALAKAIQVNANSNSVVLINGSISESGGAFGLQIGNATSDQGTVILAGSNSFTGAVTYKNTTNAVLRIANSFALGSTVAGTTVIAGTALELSNNISVGAEALSIAGTGVTNSGVVHNIHGTNSYAGTVTLTNTASIVADANTALTLSGGITGNFAKTFAGAGNVTSSGIVSGSGGVIKTGAGTLTLAATNTYTGNLTISNGAVRGISNAAAFGAPTAVVLSGGNMQMANDTALNFAEAVTVSSNGSMVSDRLTAGAGVTHTNNTLSIGARTLTVAAGSNVTSGTAGVAFSGTTTLSATGAVFSVSSGAQLTLGAVSGNTFGFTVGGAGNTVIGGVIGTTTGGVTKTGSGTLALSAANTYTGDTIAGEGVLSLSGSGSIADGSTVVVSNGATFDLNSVSDTVDGVSGAGAVTLGSATLTVSNSATNNLSGVLSGTGGLIKVGTGTQILSGTTNSYGGTTTIGGGVLSVGTLSNAGLNSSIGTNGTIILTNGGKLDYSGAATTNDRTINLTGNGVLSTSNNLTLSGVITNTGNLTKEGLGTLLLVSSNSYSGTTTVSAGALNIQNANALGATTSGVTVSNGAALELQGGITVGAEALTINGTGISSGGALRNISGDNRYGGAITLASVATIVADAATLFLDSTVGGNFAKTFNGSGNIFANGAISGSGGVIKTGAGSLALSVSNSFTGDISVRGGTVLARSNAFALGSGNVILAGGNLTLANDTGLSATNSVIVSNNTTITSDRLASGAGVTHTLGTLTNGAVTIDVNAGSNVGSGAAGLTFGNVTLTASGATYNANTGVLLTLGAISGNTFGFTIGGAGNTSINGVVGTTTGTLTKSDLGTLVMGSAANTYGGVTTVGGGVIQVTNLANAGASSSIGTNGTIILTNSGTLDYAGTTNTGINRGISLAAGNGVIGVSNSAVALTNTGVISNSGTLVKSGAGTLILTASNTYGGGTILSGGVLQITNGNSVGTGTITFTNSLTDLVLRLAAGVTLTNGITVTTNSSQNTIFRLASTASTISGSITGSGDLNLTGAGTNTFSASNSYTGQTLISAGTLILGNTNALSGSTLNYTSTGVLSFGSLTGATFGGLQGTNGLALTNTGGTAVALIVGANNSSTTYSGALSGSGSLTKVGAGTFSLSGSNSFTGVTAVSNGAIRVSNTNSLGATSGGTTVSAGAALEVEGGIAIGAEALSLSNNGISSGGALRSISGANTYGGLITLGTGVAVGVDADSLTLTGGVTSGAGSSFTKVGAGTLILNSTSTPTGIVTISGGTMQLGTNGAIAPVALNVTNGSTFDLNGRNATLGATGNLNVYLTGATLKSGAGTISLSALGVTVHSAANANSSTISGNLNLGGVTNTFNVADGGAAEDLVVSAAVSNGGLIKTNTGLMSLTASNSFTGATTVSGGTLKLDSSSGSSLGSTTNVIVGSGATLLIARSNQVNNSASVTLSGGTIRTGAGLSEAFGNLNLTTGSFLDFGATYGNASSMTFGTYTPGSLLTINNFDFGSTLIFGSDLTSTINNSSFFTFTNGGIASSSWNGSTFTITAIPETSTYVAAFGLLALLIWPLVRRRHAK